MLSGERSWLERKGRRGEGRGRGGEGRGRGSRKEKDNTFNGTLSTANKHSTLRNSGVGVDMEGDSGTVSAFHKDQFIIKIDISREWVANFTDWNLSLIIVYFQ